MGSVKDLKLINSPTETTEGKGYFTFSDRYSVFDWGEMPDLITNKGAALALIGAFFFEELEKQGVKTHYLGLVEDGKEKKLAELKAPSNIMAVKLLRVIKPTLNNNEYQYDAYKNIKSNFLIPLEVIYRNSLPAGSSVFKRLKSGQTTISDLGLDKLPEPGQKFNPPLLDVSTKLEEIDRYINWTEALAISGLSQAQLDSVKNLVLKINSFITNTVSRFDLINEDGKFEFGVNSQGEIILVDVLGTPDECRFTFQDTPVSKEIARIYYRKSDWFKEISQAKSSDPINWRKSCPAPEPLPTELHKLISFVYQSFCNELTGRQWFNSPDLKSILSDIKNYL